MGLSNVLRQRLLHDGSEGATSAVEGQRPSASAKKALEDTVWMMIPAAGGSEVVQHGTSRGVDVAGVGPAG